MTAILIIAPESISSMVGMGLGAVLLSYAYMKKKRLERARTVTG